MKLCAANTLFFLFRSMPKNKNEPELEISPPPLPAGPNLILSKNYDIKPKVVINKPIQNFDAPLPAKKPSFFEKLKERGKEKRAKNEEESKINRAIEMAKKPISQSAIAANNSNLAEIQKKLINARSALLDLKVDEAKKIYQEINQTYAMLNAKDKAAVYPDIIDLYNDRKIAEKFARSRK